MSDAFETLILGGGVADRNDTRPDWAILQDILRNINAMNGNNGNSTPPTTPPSNTNIPQPPPQPSEAERLVALHGGYKDRVPMVIPPLTASHTYGGTNGKWLRNSPGTCWDGKRWLNKPLIQYCKPEFLTELDVYGSYWSLGTQYKFLMAYLTAWLLDAEGDDYILQYNYAKETLYADGTGSGQWNGGECRMLVNNIPLLTDADTLYIIFSAMPANTTDFTHFSSGWFSNSAQTMGIILRSPKHPVWDDSDSNYMRSEIELTPGFGYPTYGQDMEVDPQDDTLVNVKVKLKRAKKTLSLSSIQDINFPENNLNGIEPSDVIQFASDCDGWAPNSPTMKLYEAQISATGGVSYTPVSALRSDLDYLCKVMSWEDWTMPPPGGSGNDWNFRARIGLVGFPRDHKALWVEPVAPLDSVIYLKLYVWDQAYVRSITLENLNHI